MDVDYFFFPSHSDGSCCVWSSHTSSRTFGALWSFHSYHNTVRPDVHDAKRLRKVMMHQRFLCQSKWSKKGKKNRSLITVFFRASVAEKKCMLWNGSCNRVTHFYSLRIKRDILNILIFFFLGVNQQQLTKKLTSLICFASSSSLLAHVEREFISDLSCANSEFMRAALGSAPPLNRSNKLQKLLF